MQVAVAAGVVSGAAGSGMADLALNILVNQIDNVQIGKVMNGKLITWH